MEEIWKPIKNFPNYSISNLGRVRSNRYGNFIKPQDYNGYKRVFVGNKNKLQLVHRLVAEAFIENPLNKPQVNHIDEDKGNNRVDNLEWVTNKENMNYGERTKKASESCKKPILKYSKDGEFLEWLPSMTDAQNKYGFNKSKISLACNGKRKTAYGYVWSFA